jgi:hypothetical protein
MILAGHQPNYLPWLGFFDKIQQSDVFVVADNVQFEIQGFTNRNKIKMVNVAKWLTVPIEHAREPQLINQVKISSKVDDWAKKHWLSIKQHYSRAPYWKKYSEFFEQTYLKDWSLLIDVNMHLIRGIMAFLEITTPLVMASSLKAKGKNSDLLLAYCKEIGADTYLAGTGSKAYLDVEKFNHAGVKVVFQDFEYPVYQQRRGEFIANLSVVDYLFCTGGAPWRTKKDSCLNDPKRILSAI